MKYRLKNTTFWDITPCSPLKVNRRFGGTYRLHLLGRIRRARYQQILATCFHAGILLSLFFGPEYGGDVPPKRGLTLDGLYGVVSQKTELFITTAVRHSNPTKYKFLAHMSLLWSFQWQQCTTYYSGHSVTQIHKGMSLTTLGHLNPTVYLHDPRNNIFVRPAESECPQ
jgi:hypothetical protein